MKNLRVIAFAFLSALYIMQAGAQVRVILDTDIDSDADDVGALAMMLNLHRKQVVDLAGIIVTSDDTYAALCTQAICTFYGYPDMPIGVNRNQQNMRNYSRYTRQIADEFPRAANAWADIEDAARLYRRLLAESTDNGVVIVTIGHLSSLRDLLVSSSDAISPLDGKTLVEQKVSRWLCMGGEYPGGKEANFYRPDPASTVHCLAHWTKDVVFSGWEIGNQVNSGGEYVKNMLPERHPVWMGYQLYNQFAGRASWDQTIVLLLTDQGAAFFDENRNGRCVVAEDGSNVWEPGPACNHAFLTFRDGVDLRRVEQLIDDLIIGNPIFLTP